MQWQIPAKNLSQIIRFWWWEWLSTIWNFTERQTGKVLGGLCEIPENTDSVLPKTIGKHLVSMRMDLLKSFGRDKNQIHSMCIHAAERERMSLGRVRERTARESSNFKGVPNGLYPIDCIIYNLYIHHIHFKVFESVCWSNCFPQHVESIQIAMSSSEAKQKSLILFVHAIASS